MDTSLVEALFAMARGREVASAPQRPASELQDLVVACWRQVYQEPAEPPQVLEPQPAPAASGHDWLW